MNRNAPCRPRRNFLMFGAALGVGALAPVSLAQAALSGERRLAFHNLHTGENLATTYWVDGRYIPAATAEIDHVLRDFRTGDIVPIDVRLLDLLHALHAAMDSDAPFHLISGYRSPKTNEALRKRTSGVAKKSFHMKGMAADVRLPGRRLTDLHRTALALKLGGVGYYPKSDFLHVDLGRVRSW